MKATPRLRAILSCDCHNFSLLMVELGDMAIELIDEMYRRCGECIVSHRGRIVKYMGDGMLAVFEADDAAEAVLAARCARSTYRELLAAWHTKAESEMEVGLTLGNVVEGVVGHPSHQGFDVFGEAVNEAAVIGHHRGIAMTDAFRRRLGPETPVREIEPFRPKWRKRPLPVWEVAEPDAG